MQAHKNYIERAVAIARSYGATRIILFGSALADPGKSRDLDLAVEGVHGWDFFGLVAELESELPLKIDLIPLDHVEENHFTQAIRERGRIVFQDESLLESEADEGR